MKSSWTQESDFLRGPDGSEVRDLDSHVICSLTSQLTFDPYRVGVEGS